MTRTIKVYQRENFYSNVHEQWETTWELLHDVQFKNRVDFLNGIRYAKKDFKNTWKYRVVFE